MIIQDKHSMGGMKHSNTSKQYQAVTFSQM